MMPKKWKFTCLPLRMPKYNPTRSVLRRKRVEWTTSVIPRRSKGQGDKLERQKKSIIPGNARKGKPAVVETSGIGRVEDSMQNELKKRPQILSYLPKCPSEYYFLSLARLSPSLSLSLVSTLA